MVRPNLVRSTTDLVRDVLAAAGKNPAAVHSPRLSVADAWKATADWLSAACVTDIIVERAHRLLPGEGLDLTKLADAIDADLWLIWSSPGDTFDQLNITYRAEARRADEFVRRHRHELTPGRTPGEFQRKPNAYLRDERRSTPCTPARRNAGPRESR